MDPKQMVAEGYDRLHDRYAGWTSAGHDGLRHQYIDKVLELARTAPRTALDLGCGTGCHATAYLVAKGLEVTGVDISRTSVEVAARQVSSARFFTGDMASIELPQETFDLVTAFYSLIHVPKEEHGAVLSRVWSWLTPGGYLVVTMGGGRRPGDSVEPAWLGVAPMYWSNWDVDTSQRLVRDTGFEEVEANLETIDEDGRKVTFLWVIARKPGETRG
ncbi:MAG: class I SAM-dependent methyltransferase [Acidimicrobiaceae bacterium]|nr:class I SAM-dependent methyltransferase [Acidimicrobiaceae bacterium]